MNPTPPTTWKHLAPNPKSSYQQLFVSGTRITARTLYGWYAGPEPMTPEFIAEQFNLPAEAVLESIAYCESNPPELLRDYAMDQALMEAVGPMGTGCLTPEDHARIHRS